MLIPSQQRTVKRSSGYSHVYHFMHLSLASSQSPESACCLQNEQQSTINNTWGFLDGSVVEPTCQCRRRRFDPWLGKIPHAKCLSLCAAAITPVLKSPGAATIDPTCWNHWSPRSLEATLRNKKSHPREKKYSSRWAPAHRHQRKAREAKTQHSRNK